MILRRGRRGRLRTRQPSGHVLHERQALPQNGATEFVARQQIEIEVRGVLQVAQLKHDDRENGQTTVAQPLLVVVVRGRSIEAVGGLQDEIDAVR